MKTPLEIAADIRATHPHVAEMIHALVRRWQPIETAPKDGTVILLWGPYCQHATTAYWLRNRWQCSADGTMALESQGDTWSDYAEFSVPTHWMPLPEPPGHEAASPHPDGHMERDGLGNARFVPPGEGTP